MLTKKPIAIKGHKRPVGLGGKTMRRWLLAAFMIMGVTGLAFSAYFQSFEMDTFNWTGATRVSTGTHGVPSKTGAFHAEDQNLSGQTFTRWSGYSRTLPPGGYSTTQAPPICRSRRWTLSPPQA